MKVSFVNNDVFEDYNEWTLQQMIVHPLTNPANFPHISIAHRPFALLIVSAQCILG
jgi:hypothetical protein